ncbi:HS12B-like protein, partial [Mya arenaria]
MQLSMAKIDTNRLKLGLEPECASIWCETLGMDVKCAVAIHGSHYMVVDLGGGTADISVHERNPDGTLKEILKSSGGPWGGIFVDENYMKMLGRLTTQAYPDFTTDPGCELIGTITLENSSDVPFEEQEIEHTFLFGDTELL